MIDHVEPKLRSELVWIRLAALKKGVDCTIEMIQSLRQRAQLNGLDSVAVSLLESEINYLDGRASEALEIYTRYVDPALTEIDPRVASILADNKSLLLWEGLSTSAGDDLCHFVDQRRMLGVELRDHAAVLEASIEAARGRHFLSLPIYWQQLRTSYKLQNWRSRALAERAT